MKVSIDSHCLVSVNDDYDDRLYSSVYSWLGDDGPTNLVSGDCFVLGHRMVVSPWCSPSPGYISRRLPMPR